MNPSTCIWRIRLIRLWLILLPVMGSTGVSASPLISPTFSALKILPQTNTTQYLSFLSRCFTSSNNFCRRLPKNRIALLDENSSDFENYKHLMARWQNHEISEEGNGNNQIEWYQGGKLRNSDLSYAKAPLSTMAVSSKWADRVLDVFGMPLNESEIHYPLDYPQNGQSNTSDPFNATKFTNIAGPFNIDASALAAILEENPLYTTMKKEQHERFVIRLLISHLGTFIFNDSIASDSPLCFAQSLCELLKTPVVAPNGILDVGFPPINQFEPRAIHDQTGEPRELWIMRNKGYSRKLNSGKPVWRLFSP